LTQDGMLARHCGLLLRLSDWLDGEPIEGFSFDGTRWTERSDLDAGELADALGREVLDNYADRKWLERRLELLGYDRLAAHVRGTLLPPVGNTRTGDFGEIVAGFVVRRHFGFLIPVQRLRYKDSPSGTQRLIDVVAFKFRKPPELTTICVSEVKTRTGKVASIAADAAEQLADAVDDLALSLSYIDRRLTELGKHALADRVLALLDPQARYELDKHVFIVTDVETLHDEALDRLEQADGDKDLAASIVLIAALRDMIADSYQAAGELGDLAG
jgi:Cap4 SAVED domain